MTADLRLPVAIAVFVFLGVVIWMAGKGDDKPAEGTEAGTAAGDLNPWLLEARWRRTLRFKPAEPPNRFPSKPICNAEKRKRIDKAREEGARSPFYRCCHAPRGGPCS